MKIMSSLPEFDGNSKLGLIIVSSRFFKTSSVRTFDENNSTADLISAAIAYLESAKIASICGEEFSEGSRVSAMKVNWPKWWDKSWIKPGTVDRDLEKAGALVAAALDRFNKNRK